MPLHLFRDGTRVRAGGMLEHADVTFWWVAVGVVTFPVLFFVSAPYGKLVRDGWGGRVDGRLGWFVQEIPSPVVLTLSFLYGGDLLAFSDAARAKTAPSAFAYACLAVWWAHYLNRAVYYPLVRRMSDTTVPVVLMAIAFNFVNGTLVGTELARGSEHLAEPSVPRLALGASLFVAGAGLNGPLAPPCPPLGVNAAASLRKHRKLLKTKISPLSSGVSPLQHSNTPSRRSFSSRSLKWCRIASATRRLSFAVPLDSARRQYAPKSAPSI